MDKAAVPEITISLDIDDEIVQISRNQSCAPVIWEIHVVGFWAPSQLGEDLENTILISLEVFSEKRSWLRASWISKGYALNTVSYTHLTLPTKRIV